jgi:hypothetical protein
MTAPSMSTAEMQNEELTKIIALKDTRIKMMAECLQLHQQFTQLQLNSQFSQPRFPPYVQQPAYSTTQFDYSAPQPVPQQQQNASYLKIHASAVCKQCNIRARAPNFKYCRPCATARRECLTSDCKHVCGHGYLYCYDCKPICQSCNRETINKKTAHCSECGEVNADSSTVQE